MSLRPRKNTNKRFEQPEKDRFIAQFKLFDATNGKEGLDPNQKDVLRYKKADVKSFGLSDPVLSDAMDQPESRSGQNNGKLYGCFTKAAEQYLEMKAAGDDETTEDDTAALQLKEAPPTPKIANNTSQQPNRGTGILKGVTPKQGKKAAPPEIQTAKDHDYEADQARFDSKYVKTLKVLGTGSYGKVFLGEVKNQYVANGNDDSRVETVAIKVPHEVHGWGHEKLRAKAKAAVRNALVEVKIWTRLSEEKSPFILELLDHFVLLDEQQLPTLYTVTRCMHDGELEGYIEWWPNKKVRIGGLSEKECRIIAKQVLLAIAHMDACNVVHRDIKPDNIMIELNPETKTLAKIELIDLGTAKTYSVGLEDQLQTNVGTDFFQAPEVASGQGYCKKVDVFSCGMTLLISFFGYWTDAKLRSLHLSKEEDEEITFVWHRHWNLGDVYTQMDPFVEKILKLVIQDPQERSSLDEALESFWHVQDLTDQQCRDFAFGADKLLKLKGLGFLRQENNLPPGDTVAEDLRRQLQEARTQIAEQQAKIADQQGDLEAKNVFIQKVAEESARLLKVNDAVYELRATVTDDE